MSGTGSGKYASLAKLLQKTEWAGDEVLSLCPFHEDSSPSFRFNVRKGLFICFACGEKGAAAKLAKKLGTIISDDASLGDLRYAMQALKDIEEPHKQEVKSERSLGRFMGAPHVAWRRRGFSNHTVKKFNLGYDPMNDNLTIPYRNSDGELLGVVTRRIGNGYPKYLYPKGFPRNTNLYGAHMVEGIETVALVEGSLDAVWCWQNDIPAVGQWGSSLSEYQVEILREMGVKSVVLLHDYDLAGRKGAFQAYRALSDFIRITPAWDEEKYCWHEWLCGCKKRGKPGHTMLKAVTCPDRRPCRCGKIHGADPGSLTGDELKALVPQKFRITDATRFVSQLKFHEAENRRSNPRKN